MIKVKVIVLVLFTLLFTLSNNLVLTFNGNNNKLIICEENKKKTVISENKLS